MNQGLAVHGFDAAVPDPLLAGNGHVFRDIGVPQWLDAPLRRRVRAVRWVERGDPVQAFDERIEFEPQRGPDPCAALRAPP